MKCALNIGNKKLKISSLFYFSILLAAFTLSNGCTTSFEKRTTPCKTDEDCKEGEGCAENLGVCLEKCVSAEDCPDNSFRCEGGLCFEVVDAECKEVGDCDSPEPCETLESAECVEGECSYSELACNDPPGRECVNNDSTLRVYTKTGVCDPEIGECIYDYTDIPCTECTVNCLENDPCQDIVCEDTNGGCRINGVCLPTSPPTCQYENAPINTVCDREGSAEGVGDGYCNEGICGDKVQISCTQNSECAPETCVGGYCRNQAELYGTCDPGDSADCENGLECKQEICLKENGETCSTNDECAETCINSSCASLSNSSGPCDSGNGGDDDDCSAGLFCNDGVCETSPSCNQNSECSGDNTCIGGYCRSRASTGGTCDVGDDADCVSGNLCANGVCLLQNGQTCTSNSSCANVCINGACSSKSDTGGLCDTDDLGADCLEGHMCSGSKCRLLDGQTGCATDEDCLNTCVQGTCGPLVGLGGVCDSPGDCSGGLDCYNGYCLGGNGQSCNDNSECVNTCILNLCSDQSSTTGYCDSGDDDDCLPGHECEGSQCLLGNGRTCTSNAQCINTCLLGECNYRADTLEYCDSGDDDDCVPGHLCTSNKCRLTEGQNCNHNDECVEVCINGSCSGLAGVGSACDEHEDCEPDLPCLSGSCKNNGVWTIRVTGESAEGGGGNSLSGWNIVDELGAYIAEVSGGPSPAQYLAQEINWEATLMDAVLPGEFFALKGNEGSMAVSRTFTFFDGFESEIQSLTVGPVDTGYIVRTFTSNRDNWVRFLYENDTVTYTQRHKPIASILVQGLSTSGGGNGLSGYFEVGNTGANLGQLSPGTSGKLYSITNWEVDLTSFIYGGMSFALVGSESSSATNRTFTFKDAGGHVIDMVTITNSDTADIIRSSNWPSGDTYVHFTYQNGGVNAVEKVSN